MSRLVVVLPLEENAYDDARRLLERGPPTDLEATQLDRHDVYLTRREVVFVFETDDAAAALQLSGEDPGLWRAAAEWRKLMAGRPRAARTAYTWRRSTGGGDRGGDA